MAYAPETPSTALKRLVIFEHDQALPEEQPRDTLFAQVNRHIKFDPSTLNTLDVEGCSAVHYDLLMLCAAVELADRRWKRPSTWRREFSVTVPVVDLTRWQNPNVVGSLERALKHLTNDTWQFTFTQAVGTSPIGTQQRALDFGRTKTFAVAYSDGLDSRAVSALSGPDAQALRIRVVKRKANWKPGEGEFTQIPFVTAGFRPLESSFRTRAFLFAVIAGLASHLCGVSRIVVPESGQGALGPVLLPLHRIYPDYRNHPTYFRKIEAFITAILGIDIHFDQPRLWSTKGETMAAFLALSGKTDTHLTNTRSCWQSRRIVNLGNKKQCGLCAACLLRRLSLHAAGVTERSDNYVISDLTVATVDAALSPVSQKVDRDIMIEYGSVGARHMQHLADLAEQPDDALRLEASEIAEALGEPYQYILKNLRQLLVTHANEWRAFRASQGEQSFLHTWMDGGRYGRPQ